MWRSSGYVPGVLLGLGVGLLLTGCGKPPGAQQRAGPGLMGGMVPEVAAITVTEQPVLLTTELPGRTEAYLIAEIRPQVSGLILKRLFEEGSEVQAGQVLYQIDPAPFQAAYDSAAAALARAEANLPAVRARAERFQELLANKAISQQAYDDAAAALRQVEADIQFYKAAVETAKINLAYTRITAPISGRIGKSSVTDGAIVTAYQPVALATIQQLDPIYVNVPQSTTELLRLQKRLADGRLKHEGTNQNSVKLILEDGSTYPLEGTLQFRDVSVDPTTGSVILRMVFPNPNRVLLPGMFVRAIVREGINERAILIPQQAVSRDHKGNPYVLVVGTNSTAQLKMVQIERAIGDKWLIESGLQPGDKLIVEGLQRLRPGMPVKEAQPGATATNAPTATQAQSTKTR
ncbi:MAG: efflux RND transporter periplasmic adaptor subunit [Verrucomicrobiae bacterium]|nr:efflux RND transporter periplasmic adaptor subunit [Verrucomicrobiae bacterium]